MEGDFIQKACCGALFGHRLGCVNYATAKRASEANGLESQLATLKAENDRLRFDLNHLAAKAKDVLKTGLPIDHEPNCECVVCLNHFLLVEKLAALEAK